MKKASQEWRVKQKCENCPFHESGPGRHLRDSLMPGRFEGIVKGLMDGEHFFCHKTTTDDDWDEDSEDGGYFGKGLVCAGALELQKQAGIKSVYQQVCERIRMIQKKGLETQRAPTPKSTGAR